MSKSHLLLASLDEFYNVPEHFEQLKSILTHSSAPSLRNLEWYITVHAKQKCVIYDTPNGKFPVHVAYKSSLVGYSKKYFDPFCRTERIEFRGLTTTVAQLNFIRWCIKNDIIRHAERDPRQSESRYIQCDTH